MSVKTGYSNTLFEPPASFIKRIKELEEQDSNTSQITCYKSNLVLL